jgi:uncharacterized membrane-anchored protein
MKFNIISGGIILNLLALLVYFNVSISKKENILKEGNLILLELAPVDPRSLMQGDFMRLAYDLANDRNHDTMSKRGFCVVKLDSTGIGHVLRFQSEHEPLNSQEYLIEYNLFNNDVSIGAESYFFQEGQGEKFEKAKYGGVRVDVKGNSVLVGLYDDEQNIIK